MTVTLDLKPEIEKQLAEKAAQKGLKIETYLKIFIEESIEKEKPFYETATKEEWLAEFNKWVDSHKDKNYPSISNEALRRENIY